MNSKLIKAIEHEAKYSIPLRIAATLWKHGVTEKKFHKMIKDNNVETHNGLLTNVYNYIRDMERKQLERGIKVKDIPLFDKIELILKTEPRKEP